MSDGRLDISLWMDGLGDPIPRAPLAGDLDCDVAIVGGGYTGLWTAYYLKTLAPALSVCILEAEVVGFGASGRNGGWLMAAFEGEAGMLAGMDGQRRETARDLVHGIIPEVEAVLAREQIDCDYRRGGGIFAAARYPEQERFQREWLAQLHASGQREQDYRWLDADELSARLRIRNPLGAIYTPHVARVQPAMLALGLAASLERMGVQIFEQTRVSALGEGEFRTDRGIVRAGTRVLAVEGFSFDLPQLRRRVLPVQSRIIATEPLGEAQWQQLGLEQREVFSEASPLVTYGQRSADDRLVFGSRGSYRYGGLPRSDFTADHRAFDSIHRLLLDCFPQLQGVGISRCWGGTLGVPRAGVPHAVYDSQSGLGTAGGYLGEGVGASNLMARSLVDLILDRTSEAAAMPWCHSGHPDRVLRRWEPEPLRWLGFRAISGLLALEESSYRRSAPAWQRRLVGRASGYMASLRD